MKSFKEWLAKEGAAESFGSQVIGAAYGGVEGVANAIADMASTLVRSVVFGPKAREHFDNKRLNDCFTVILRKFASLSEEERNEAYDGLVSEINKSIGLAKNQYPNHYGYLSHVTEPAVRTLVAGLRGVWNTFRSAHAHSDPVGGKDNAVVRWRDEIYDDCNNNFAKLMLVLDRPAREKLLAKLKEQVYRMNNPGFFRSALRNVGRMVYNSL